MTSIRWYFQILCADVLEPDAGVPGIMGSDYHAARRASSLFIPYPHAESCHSRPTGHVPFFPTMKSELRSVWLSMRNRGLTAPAQLVRHPAASFEYVLVPLLLRCLQIADQLSLSAVARGAECPRKTGKLLWKGDRRSRLYMADPLDGGGCGLSLLGRCADMIVLKNVSFQYEGCEEGVHAIDLTVYDGECVVLTGPSGGGKTTLTRLINGLAPSYYRGTQEGICW